MRFGYLAILGVAPFLVAQNAPVPPIPSNL
jgi:hypothetical protein